MNPANRSFLEATRDGHRIEGLRKLQEALKKAGTLQPLSANEKKIVAMAKKNIAVHLKHKAMSVIRRMTGRGK